MLVHGQLVRRFYRSGAGARSLTEVVATGIKKLRVGRPPMPGGADRRIQRHHDHAGARLRPEVGRLLRQALTSLDRPRGCGRAWWAAAGRRRPPPPGRTAIRASCGIGTYRDRAVGNAAVEELVVQRRTAGASPASWTDAVATVPPASRLVDRGDHVVVRARRRARPRSPSSTGPSVATGIDPAIWTRWKGSTGRCSAAASTIRVSTRSQGPGPSSGAGVRRGTAGPSCTGGVRRRSGAVRPRARCAIAGVAGSGHSRWRHALLVDGR